MGSVTFSVDEGLKADLDHFSWVNWSEVARAEILKNLEISSDLGKFLQIVSKSKFTEKDAEFLSAKVKASMHKRLQEKGLI